MAVHSLVCCLPENKGDARPWQYTVWAAVCLRMRVMLGHGSTQSGLLPETEGDVRPWQYTVWTAVCLRIRVILGHGSTQSGLLSV